MPPATKRRTALKAKRAALKTKRTALQAKRTALKAKRTVFTERSPLRVGICGCGGISRMHVRNFLNLPDVRIVALADIVLDHAFRLRDEELVPGGHHVSAFNSLEEMVDKAKLDAVAILTPHTTHYPQVKYSLQHGLHVLCEKPFVTQTKHARDLVRLYKRKKKVLAVAVQGPSSPEFHYIRDLVESDALGKLVAVCGHTTQNWIKWVRTTWRGDPKYSGGGFIYDTGAHLLTAMVHLSGKDPVEVCMFSDNKGAKVDVVSTLMVRFRGRVQGTLQFNGDSTIFDNSITLYFENGAVRTSMYGGELQHWIGSDLVKYPRVPDIVGTTQADFLGAIQGKNEVSCTPETGLRVCRLLDAAYTSARTGKPVKVK